MKFKKFNLNSHYLYKLSTRCFSLWIWILKEQEWFLSRWKNQDFQRGGSINERIVNNAFQRGKLHISSVAAKEGWYRVANLFYFDVSVSIVIYHSFPTLFVPSNLFFPLCSPSRYLWFCNPSHQPPTPETSGNVRRNKTI